MRCPNKSYKFVKFLVFGASTLWVAFHLRKATSISWLSLIVFQNGSKQKLFPPMTLGVVVKFLKQLFSRFGTLEAWKRISHQKTENKEKNDKTRHGMEKL
ncbi:hypothetical protein Tco_0075812 [Tanacetum coccineum]